MITDNLYSCSSNPENISCCGLSSLTTTNSYTSSPFFSQTSPTVSETTTPAPVGPCNCGIPNKPNRIFGGNETEPNEYPWVVFLSIGGTSLCGGSIIGDRHVLTAAHCVDGTTTASDLSVYVGTHDRTRPAKIVSVSAIDIHPTWTGSVSTGSDSAVLTLSETLEFSETVRPLCLSVDPSSSYAGQAAVASGWGLDDSNAIPNNLRDVDVEIISNDECRNTWSYVKE